MTKFGAIPEGERWGAVPAFPLKLANLKPGPKALYAALCTNADTTGLLWRSLARLADEFDVSRRQIQRWINDLEAHGLLVRIGKQGRSEKFIVTRDPAGLNWARSKSLKAVVGRRIVATPNGKEGARRKWGKRAVTSASEKTDMDVTQSGTPMSPEHTLLNTTALTKKDARQESKGTETYRPHRAPFGLKRLNQNPNGEAIQGALALLAHQLGGWDILASRDPSEIADRLLQDPKAAFTTAEVIACLESPAVPR